MTDVTFVMHYWKLKLKISQLSLDNIEMIIRVMDNLFQGPVHEIRALFDMGSMLKMVFKAIKC